MLNAAAKHNNGTIVIMPAATQYDRSKIPSPEFVRAINKIRGEYRCFCGTLFVARHSNIQSGGTKSCGCLRVLSHTTHGQSRTEGGAQPREYQSWQNMKRRCLDPNHPRYKDYGGRGITVFPPWRDDFIAFSAYMGPCPDGHTIERPDNNKGYEPGNVKWVPLSEQSKNRRCVPIYTVRGVTGPLKMLCEKFSVPYASTRLRVTQGCDVEAAMFTARLGTAGHVPLHGKNKDRIMTFTVQGVTGSLKFLCRHFKRPYVTARRRVRKGWTPEAAMFTAPDASKQRY